jgi:YVTN family beta-propeller protein
VTSLRAVAGAAVVAATLVAGCGGGGHTSRTIATSVPAPPTTTAPPVTSTVPRPGRIPPSLSAKDVYAADHRGNLSPTVAKDPARVYVPNSMSDSVDVIDQQTLKVIKHFKVGRLPQHVTPSWDLKTLWVSNDEGNTLTAIDPQTSAVRRTVRVADPYNLYFTADGRRAIVVAEKLQRLDFREPHTMALRKSVPVRCAGIDHMDYTADGTKALASCEFSGRLAVIDLVREKVLRYVALGASKMPQDVKLSPDGRHFFVADMSSGGVWIVNANNMHRRFESTGEGAHGLYINRDSRFLFVTNRDEGTISVLDANSGRRLHKWRLPGGGSPDMGGVSASGRVLWLSGRYNGVVYAIDTGTGALIRRIQVGNGPHGLAVWPQPGRYSIGHTGIMR